ncbi:hypothetical protein Y032_0066g3698 [Ancylostoma ceylanicum]|uniref:DUF7083 domain-containing protein n=1 Tax=Ancylostoma ceylanicum TaxID=53326 RepID=A0A016TZQ4_9BILA|nr:hypothetical protein Y032_0066g3698 [Ancylostoma ceylanicum]
MMTMLQDMMREERKEMMEMFLKHLTRSEPMMGANEMASVPNVMSALSSRIDKFVFDPNTDMRFTEWFMRYKDVFVEDAKQLTESARVRLLCEKLDAGNFERYQRHPRISLIEGSQPVSREGYVARPQVADRGLIADQTRPCTCPETRVDSGDGLPVSAVSERFILSVSA